MTISLRNLLSKIVAGELPIAIRLVISSNPGAKGIAFANEAGIPVQVFQRKVHALSYDLQAHWYSRLTAEAFPGYAVEFIFVVVEKRRPQDGRLKTVTPDGEEVELRLSTMPTAFGEKLVMRIFNPDEIGRAHV